MKISRDSTIGGDWALVGWSGLSAAATRRGVDLSGDLDRAAVQSLVRELSLASGWLPLHDQPSAACLKQLHLGLQRTLCGHGRQRRFGVDGGLNWIKQHDCDRDLFSRSRGTELRSVKLTRALLPNWIDGGERFAPATILPLYWIALGSLALPLADSRAVLLAPLTLGAADPVAWCRALLPETADGFWPASGADALLDLAARIDDREILRECVGFVGYEFGWSATNKKFREIRSVLRCDRLPDLDAWREFSRNVPPVPLGEDGFIPDAMRGFVAGNLIAGNRPYHGFADFSRGRPLHHLRRGSRAVLNLFGSES